MQVDLRESWWIRDVEIPSRLVLAPMAGVSVQAFRRQGRRYGAGLVCSEMVSCAGLEHRIATLEERLVAARVIEKGEVSKDVVSIGSHVRLRDVDAKETVEYHIVGSAEANPAEHRLSNESPVGKAIIGHKKGETVEVPTPRGSLKYKILEIKAA